MTRGYLVQERYAEDARRVANAMPGALIPVSPGFIETLQWCSSSAYAEPARWRTYCNCESCGAPREDARCSYCGVKRE